MNFRRAITFGWLMVALFGVNISHAQSLPVVKMVICDGGDGSNPPGGTPIGQIFVNQWHSGPTLAPGDLLVQWNFGYTGDVPGEVVTGAEQVPSGWKTLISSRISHPLAPPGTEIFNLSAHAVSNPASEPSQWIFKVPTSAQGQYVENLACIWDIENVRMANPVQAVEFNSWNVNGAASLNPLVSKRSNSLALALFIDDDYGFTLMTTPSGWFRPLANIGGFPSYNYPCCAIDGFALAMPSPGSTGAITTTMGIDSGYGVGVLLNGR